MKVEEAKNKVCPFIQSAACVITSMQPTNSDLGSFQENIQANINCICGDCMAWEWTHFNRKKDQPNTCEGTEGYCKRIG